MRTVISRAIVSRAIVVATGLAAGLLAPSLSFAHAVCGNRTFWATLNVDDPGVGDELSLPTVVYTPSGSAGGQPFTQYGFEYDKTILPGFGFSINDDYQSITSAGQKYYGWDNASVGLKGEVYCNPDLEFLMSIGVGRTFAYSGSKGLINNGFIDSISSTTPTLYVGKGLGDLPIGYLRPLAITGEFTYSVSDNVSLAPNAWNFGGTIQYSIPYLQEHVKKLDLPDFVSRLTPLVEVNFNAPTQGPQLGTISPGVLYDADTWQVGVEANFPINNATRQQQGIGVVAQLHFFLDDIFSDSIGKPIFGGKK
jgi:hypothetical protein